MKTIASLEVTQAQEILERLKKEGIPATVSTAMQEESGLEIGEVVVEDSLYNRGCDVLDAWCAEQHDAGRKRSGVHCRKCGSLNYDGAWDERIGQVYKCKDCGYDWAG